MTQLWHDDTDEIKDLLIGRTVERYWPDAGSLKLDDGTVLKVVPNEGGCICGAGDYELTELNGVDNVITDVEFIYEPGGDDYERGYEGFYKIFVYADNKKVNLLRVDGSDGNGYYGTGFRIEVYKPDGSV